MHHSQVRGAPRSKPGTFPILRTLAQQVCPLYQTAGSSSSASRFNSRLKISSISPILPCCIACGRYGTCPALAVCVVGARRVHPESRTRDRGAPPRCRIVRGMGEACLAPTGPLRASGRGEARLFRARPRGLALTLRPYKQGERTWISPKSSAAWRREIKRTPN